MELLPIKSTESIECDMSNVIYVTNWIE